MVAVSLAVQVLSYAPISPDRHVEHDASQHRWVLLRFCQLRDPLYLLSSTREDSRV